MKLQELLIGEGLMKKAKEIVKGSGKKCELCGTTKNVHYIIDPYEEDVNDNIVMKNLCKHCEKELIADV